MARTAPTVDGVPNERAVSFSFIDASGDERSVRIVNDVAATNAEIEALAAALAAATNASLWRVKSEQLYIGAKQASDATNQTYPSNYDNVVINLKLSTLVTQQGYIPAPQGVMIPAGDVVDVSNALYTAVRDAYLTVVGSGYAAQSVRFTERREKNESTPAG